MAVTISPTTLPGATLYGSYSQQLTASGGTQPYTYAVTTGTLPAGLTLSSGGLLSGMSTAAGTSSVTVTATDSTPTTPQTGTRTYSLVVTETEVVNLTCPSYMCAKAGTVGMVDLGNGNYLCPRCEQESTVTGGVATLKPGYHK